MIYRIRTDDLTSVHLPVIVVLKEISPVVFFQFFTPKFILFFGSKITLLNIRSFLQRKKIRGSLFVPKFKQNICKGKYIFRLYIWNLINSKFWSETRPHILNLLIQKLDLIAGNGNNT